MQSIVKRFGTATSMKAKCSGGRNWLTPRYLRSSAAQLSTALHEQTMAALSDRPAGAVIQVPHWPSNAAIYRAMKKMGMVSQKAIYKPILKLVHRKARRAFAKKYINWTARKWRRIIFSDEKMFRVRPGGQIRCWKPKDELRIVARLPCPFFPLCM